MTREAFDALLVALDANREQAGRRYEEIRARLIKFFAWHGTAFPEDLADETIDRVTRRLSDGEQIRASDPALYFHGVARNVLREEWTRKQRHSGRNLALAAPPATGDPDADRDLERRLECLDQCLQALPPETRRVLFLYYREEKAAKLAGRQELARELGVALPALRTRLHRIRARLEDCVRRRLASRNEFGVAPHEIEGGDPS